MLSLATDYSFAMNLDKVQGRSTKLQPPKQKSDKKDNKAPYHCICSFLSISYVLTFYIEELRLLGFGKGLLKFPADCLI